MKRLLKIIIISVVMLSSKEINKVECKNIISTTKVVSCDYGERQYKKVINLLKESEDFKLLSLDPEYYDRSRKAKDKKKFFHGYKILGTHLVVDKVTKGKLVKALYDCVFDESEGDVYGAAMCFDPRHGISAEIGKNRLDLVICFECSQIKGFLNGKKFDVVIFNDKSSIFNTVLQLNHIPISD